MSASDSLNERNYSISDLPIELILSIFKFLDNRSILSVSATCKSWKCLTDDWLKWTLFLNPTFDFNNYKSLVLTKRKFSRIYINGDVLFHIVVVFFRRVDITVLSAITGMTISNTTFQLLDFNNLLKMFPNLQTIELSAVKLQNIDGSNQLLKDEDKPIVKQLRKLSFGFGTDSKLLQCFKNAKLEMFICRDQILPGLEIWGFLIQTAVKAIDFCRIASNTFFSDGVYHPFAVNFTMKRIAMDYKEVSDFDHITELLLLQHNNFETVELGHIPVLPVLSIIFSNMQNLKTLHLMPGSVANKLGNQLSLQPLLSITNLRLYYGVNCGLHPRSIEEMTIKVIKNVPNLENLELFVPYKQIYHQNITANLKKLTSLTIRVTFDTELKNLKFPPVESLRINCFDYGRGTSRHPPISMVEKGEHRETHATVRSLAYEGVTNEDVFDHIRSTFPNLQMLDVRKDIAQCEHASIAGIHDVRYRETDFFAQCMRFNC